MAVKMRLTRLGDKKAPFYRIVVTDSRKARDGGYIEKVGHYNPLTNPAEIVIDDIYADVLRDVTNNFNYIRDNQDVYSVYYDLSECIQNQFDAYNKIYDLEDKLTKLDAELQKAQVKQQEVEEIPPIIKELQNALYKEFVDYDIELRDKIQNYYIENGRTETIKMYGKSLVDDLRGKSDSEIERDCAKAAEFYVLDLIHRVTKKIGKIIDYSGIYVNGPAINGVVVGERGTTRLETIIAGGAIQRTHYRVLLK